MMADEITPSTYEVSLAWEAWRDKVNKGATRISSAEFDRYLAKRDSSKYDQGWRACKAYERESWDKIYILNDDCVPPEPEFPYYDEEGDYGW